MATKLNMADIRSFLLRSSKASEASDTCNLESEEEPSNYTEDDSSITSDEDSIEPSSKRPCTSTCRRESFSHQAHHRLSGFNPEWPKKFPWVVNEPEKKGMLCKLCIKHSRRPKKAVVGKTIWVDIPCTTLIRESLRRHECSQSHTDACVLETQLCLSRKDGGIQQSFAAIESAERKVMIAAMKCLYCLCKQEIAHTTNYVPLLELVKSIGATYLHDLNLGSNAHYTSERFLQEVVSLVKVSLIT